MSCKEESFGEVKIVNGRYKMSGTFHRPEKNRPIWGDDGKLWGITNPRDITHIHMYGGEAVFFESMAKGKLMASKCENPDCEHTGSIFMPFRIHCPDCLMKATVVDITELAKTTAKVYSFMITERTGAFNTLPTPVKFVNVEFDGVCTILMGYLCVGEPRIGMRVVPVFNTTNPTYTILDMYWVPEGTAEAELPEGFGFG